MLMRLSGLRPRCQILYRSMRSRISILVLILATECLPANPSLKLLELDTVRLGLDDYLTIIPELLMM